MIANNILQLGLLCLYLISFSACGEQYGEPPSIRDGISDGQKFKDEKKSEDGDDYDPLCGEAILQDDDFTVVVKSFSFKDEADKLAFKLIEHRVNTFVHRSAEDEWLVCVGQYKAKYFAERVLNRVHKIGYWDAKLAGPGIDNNATQDE